MTNTNKSRTGLGRRSVLAAFAAVAALSVAAIPGTAAAQDIDTLTIIVPFPAGGTTDALARIIGEKLQGKYAKTVVIDNKGGAGGRIGNEALIHAAPDGKTALLTLDLTLTLYQYVYKSLPYKLADFAPVAQIGASVQALAVGPRVPDSVKTLDEYMAWAGENEDNAFFAASGSGSGAFFIGLALSKAYDVPLTAIHYAGDAPMAAAALGGEVPATIQMLPGLVPHTKEEGGLRVLAAGGDERSKYAPEVPTFKELGYDIKADIQADIVMPAGTPEEFINKLSEAVIEIVNQPATQEAFDKFGYETLTLGPAELQASLERQVVTWGEVYAASGLTPEE
ncbi:MAG: hypothetical protein IT533_02050 [Hyphomicrobiales bacterium]|nr:hypothetical protein [Hyphomicrobiales bacterium]